MALLLIPAVFLFGIAIALLCLAIAGAVLTVALQVIAGVLWVAVKLLEHRQHRKAEQGRARNNNRGRVRRATDAGRDTAQIDAPTQGDRAALNRVARLHRVR